MSGVSSSSDTESGSPSASGSPGHQILAEQEETRLEDSLVDDKNDISLKTNEDDPTEDPLDGPLPVQSLSPQPKNENETGDEPALEAEGITQAQSDVRPQPQPEAQSAPENQPQSEQDKDENGTAGQPYTIDASPDKSRTQGTFAVTQQAEASTNGEASSGAIKDGRVKKNPVPNKYIQKATRRDGNFGVMQIGHGKAFMDARDLAAKRSSEATQAAAEEAVKSGQNGMARRKHVWKPADRNMAAPPPPQQYPQYQQQGRWPEAPYYPPLPPAPAQGHVPAYTGLPPTEVKNEQARLLTFLRSLHPVIVVDQLCKGLAYFGGIPGGPAPHDPNELPKSAKGNGSGGLMVGWMSEIFPPADFTKPPFTNFPHNLPNMGYIGPGGAAPGPAYNADGSKNDKPADTNTPGKRPRGRPKGSKNSRFRKDKGAKRLKPGDVPPHADGTPWRPSDGNDTVDLTQETNSSQPPQPPDDTAQQLATQQPAPQQPAAAQPPKATTPVRDSQVEADLSASGTSRSRKRGTSGRDPGRPKGSKTCQKESTNSHLAPAGGTATTAPGPQESPLANVARAANDATDAAYQSTYMPAPTQPKSSAQDTTLSAHAQGWVDPPASTPRELVPVSAPETTAIPPAPPAPNPAAQRSTANNARKRKQQDGPLALPKPLLCAPPPPTQVEYQTESRPVPDSTEAAQAKRRRTTSGPHRDSVASSRNSQSQSPALSTGVDSSNVTPTPAPASFGTHGAASRAPAARPSSGQAPQQHYQPPPQQQQYQQARQNQSSPLNNTSSNNMQSRQGSYSQQPQQGYYAPQQLQQQYGQSSYQSSSNRNSNNSFGTTSGASSNQQFSYDNDYTSQASNSYAASARRAMEDASLGNQSVYDPLRRR